MFKKDKSGAGAKRDAVETLERQHSRLAARLADAERRRAEADAEHRRILIEADEPDEAAIAKAGENCVAQKQLVDALTDAVCTVAEQLAGARNSLAAVEDGEVRKRVADQILERQKRVGAAADGLSAAVTALAAAHERFVDVVGRDGVAFETALGRWSAKFLAALVLTDELRRALHGAFCQVPAVAMIAHPPSPEHGIEVIARHLGPLRAAADRILSGEFPAIAPPAPNDGPSALVEIEIPQADVVLLRPVEWVGWGGSKAAGMVGPQRVPAGQATVPELVARKAVEIRIGFPLNSPQARSILMILRGQPAASLENKFGQIVAVSGHMAPKHQLFTPLDVDMVAWVEAERRRISERAA